MNVLFIHDAFPAQFGRLGLELSRRHGWRCSFLVQSLSSCPTPSREMLETLELHQVPLAAEHRLRDLRLSALGGSPPASANPARGSPR